MKLARILVVVIGIALLVAAVGCSSTPAEVAPTPNIDATVEAMAVVAPTVLPTTTLIPVPTPQTTEGEVAATVALTPGQPKDETPEVTEEVSGLKLLQLEMQPPNDMGLHIVIVEGVIGNISNKPLDVQATFNIYDKGGNLLGQARDSLSRGLPTGDKWRFEAAANGIDGNLVGDVKLSELVSEPRSVGVVIADAGQTAEVSGLKLLQWEMQPPNDMGLHIVIVEGVIENTSNKPLDVHVTFNIYDKDGYLLGQAVDYLSRGLPAGDKWRFEAAANGIDGNLVGDVKLMGLIGR